MRSFHNRLCLVLLLFIPLVTMCASGTRQTKPGSPAPSTQLVARIPFELAGNAIFLQLQSWLKTAVVRTRHRGFAPYHTPTAQSLAASLGERILIERVGASKDQIPRQLHIGRSTQILESDALTFTRSKTA